MEMQTEMNTGLYLKWLLGCYNRVIFGLQLPKESEGISHSVVFNSLQLHEPGIEPESPALQADSLPSDVPGKPT